MNRGYEEGSSADENSELEHQSQRKLPDQVAANVSFSSVNPVIKMKEEVKRAYEEESSEDEKTESVSKVKLYLSLYPLMVLF